MKGSRTLVGEELYNYINYNYITESDNIKQLEEIYKIEKIPKISITPEQGKFLYVLSKLIRANKILEIGTLIGYSTLWLAESLQDNGKIYTIEIAKKHYEIAKKFFKKINMENKINLSLGDALDLLPELKLKAPFDMIFIDAAKDKYPIYFENMLKLLRKGGIIAFDNALSKGRVLDTKNFEKGVTGVRILNKMMGQSKQVDSILVPIADGIALGCKK